MPFPASFVVVVFFSFFFFLGGGTCFVFVLFFGKIHKDCKEVFVGFFFLDSTFQLLIGWAEQAKLEINVISVLLIMLQHYFIKIHLKEEDH